jgi:glycosyltransferase involved in cell wall biosynthesis
MISASVYIATYNRASMLAETLEAMTRVDRAGLNVEWVVINNNCTDLTDEVVESFKGRLPIRLVHESEPGKNRALNRGLEDHAIPDIAVFTDDDVSPDVGWLQDIVKSCASWPDHDVFGGKIRPLWPGGVKPAWITQPWLLSIGFAWHDLGNEEKPYPPGIYPFGPNFWVRGEIFRKGIRFRESIGPVGNTRIMGSETSFLKDLDNLGHHMVYCPNAALDHRIKESDYDMDVLMRRMISYGRGRARIHGVNYRNLMTDHPRQWWLRQRLKLVVAYARLAVLGLIPFPKIRKERLLWQNSTIGWILESFRIAREQGI